MERNYIKIRILLVGFFFLAMFAAIGTKAVQLQIYRSPWLSKKASDQYEKAMPAAGKRGIIFDRHRREMALSIKVTSIAAYPAQVKDPRATADALRKVLQMDAGTLKRKLVSKKSFVWIKRQTTAKAAKAVKDLELPGLDFVEEYSRFYPNTTLAAQALGFTGLDGTGLEGLEFYYDQHLKGASRQLTVFKDALGNEFSPQSQQMIDNSGRNLVLTMDSNIQYITESALEEAGKRFAARSALAIVMQPRTGAILAISHYPIFNPNAYSEFDKSLWRNRAITDPFEPGSTMKIFSAAAALEHGEVTPSTIFYCENGSYRIGKNVVHDIHRYGWLSLEQIIKYSSNIGAVKISEKIGAKKLYDTFRHFGFGEKTGIDCPGETAGSLAHFKSWSDIDTGAISFGHGIAVSAIQLITAVSAIANDGVLMKPYIVQEITDQNGRPLNRFQPQRIRQVVSPQTANILKEIMQTVLSEGGTGVNAALDGYSVCGKTGTARKLGRDGKYSQDKHVASFIGFTPADHPEIAVLVVIDEPKETYHGGTVAAPVFKKIAQETLNYLNVPPQNGPTKFRVSLGTEVNG
jgi:cell division protein FtsI (penicillin-binding protein 3)